MANLIFNPTYTTNDQMGGWTKATLRAGFEPGAGAMNGANLKTSNLVMGNAGATVIQVPYGQTWPRG